jgi:hypothetical protein
MKWVGAETKNGSSVSVQLVETVLAQCAFMAVKLGLDAVDPSGDLPKGALSKLGENYTDELVTPATLCAALASKRLLRSSLYAECPWKDHAMMPPS